MGGKRRAQPEGNAQGRAAARGDDPGGQGGASRRRQTLGMSEDTLQRVLPLVLGCVDPEVAAQLYQTCTTWRKEMEARGFCNRTVQLCSALAECKDTDDVLQKAVRWLNASNDDGEKAFCVDARAFLERSRGGTGSLREWLQAASQEPDASFVSRGAASTALSLGLKLVHWIGKPQESNAGWETLPRHSNSVSAVAISPDRTRAVSGSNSKLAKIWNTETGAEVYTLTGHSTWVIAVSFFPGGERVLTVSGDSAKIWNVATGAEICSLHGHSDMVNSAAFSPNGKRVVSVSGDPHYEYSDEYSVRIWDVDMGAEVCALAQPGMVVMASFSPDGKRIVTGSEWGAVKLWNAETGAKIRNLDTHNGEGLCICEVDQDKNLKEDRDGERIIHPGCPVFGHSDGVHRVKFSDDGTLVMSVSVDHTVRLWDVASGTQLRVFTGDRFALVEFPSGERRRARYVLTARHYTLLIYEVGKYAAAAPVACFKAPQHISTVRCRGATICVGCYRGPVLFLSAPFLTA